MAERSPDLIPLQLFPNQGRGFGFGVTELGLDGPPEGYDRTLSMIVGRTISPSFAPTLKQDLAGSPIQSARHPAFIKSWQSSTGEPFCIVGLSSAAVIFQNGAVTDDTSGIAATFAFTSGVMHDDGAGTAYLYGADAAAIGEGAADWLSRRTQAGTWAQDADVAAKFIVAGGDGAMWRTTNDYQCSKCPAASDPFTVGLWGAAIQVGTSGAKITGGGALGAAPVWGKEDGLYPYDAANNRFENKFPVPKHPLNFTFFSPDGEGGVYTGTHDGSIVHLSAYGALTVYHPVRSKTPQRDTPRGRIADVAVWGDRLFALMAPAYRFQQPSGMKVLKTTDNFGTFTDYSANAIDRSSSTVVDVSSLDTLANGDALLIGWDDQFLAARFVISAANANASVLAMAYSTGAGTWQTATKYDGTRTDGGAAFGRLRTSSDPASNVVAFSDISTFATFPWVKATYNSLSKYWLRFTVSVALDASTQFTEIAILPMRAAPDFSTTNDIGATNIEASGLYAKVLMGRFAGDTIIWDDVLTLPSVSDAGRLTVTPIPTSLSDSSLVVACRDEIFQFPLPLMFDPALTDYPILARDAASTLSPAVYFSSVDLSDIYEVDSFEVVGRNFTAETDSVKVAFRWDDTNAWKVYTEAQGETLIPVGENWGSRLSVALQIIDGAVTEDIGPSVALVRAWLRKSDKARGSYNPPARTQPGVA